MDRRLRFRHRARTAKSERATGLVGPSAALEMRRLTPQAPRKGCRGRGEVPREGGQVGRGWPPRKAPLGKPRAPVPQTDTGGRVQAHQGERVSPRQGTRQVGPVTSGEGAPRRVNPPCVGERAGAAEKRPRRLFTKNTAPC